MNQTKSVKFSDEDLTLFWFLIGKKIPGEVFGTSPGRFGYTWENFTPVEFSGAGWYFVRFQLRSIPAQSSYSRFAMSLQTDARSYLVS